MKEIDEQIILNYTPILNKIARHYTNNKWDFEDCRQELYLKLLQCLEVYDMNKNIPLEAFIKICCTHRAISFAKNLSRHNQTEVLNEYEDEIELVEDNVRELYEYFIEYCKTHKNGDIVKKKYIEGVTTKNIAKELNCSPRWVNKKIKSFNKWFKKEINDLEC